MAAPIKNQALAGLANPVASTQMAQGLQAARTIGMQQAVAQAPAGQPVRKQAVQALGAQQAQQAGQIQTQAAQQVMQQQEQVAKLALSNQEQAMREQARERALNNRKKSVNLATKLGQLDRQLKSKLVDQSIQFEKDEMGRTLWNERQLMDFKILNAKNDAELRQFEQEYRQISERRTQMLRFAYAKIQQELEQNQQSTQQKLGQEQVARLQKAKQDLEIKMKKDAAKKKNRAAMISGAFTVAGAVAGAVYGGPAGASAGASLGGAAGNVAASQMA